jgi:hypothetical protein
MGHRYLQAEIIGRIDAPVLPASVLAVAPTRPGHMLVRAGCRSPSAGLWGPGTGGSDRWVMILP